MYILKYDAAREADQKTPYTVPEPYSYPYEDLHKVLRSLYTVLTGPSVQCSYPYDLHKNTEDLHEIEDPHEISVQGLIAISC